MEYLLSLLTSPAAWLSLLTLSILEIILGIDNIIFLSITAAKLPKHQRAKARTIGLSLALIMRVLLLASIAWIAGLVKPFMMIGDFALSWRDVILGGGGLFLIIKATMEIHEMMEPHEKKQSIAKATFSWVIFQIIILDLVFSLDSVITAVGIAEHLPIMVLAIVFAILVMMLAATPVSNFVEKHPTVKMLALAFLLVVGVALVADGLHFHIPRGYLYTAIAFSILVEVLNMLVRRATEKD